MKQCWPAPERNKGPIADVLERVLLPGHSLLEIASGTGQHAAHFAQRWPELTVHPSDLEPENLRSIGAWVEESQLPNLMQPVALDVRSAPWPVSMVDAIFNANMIHISAWECCIGLLEGAMRHLHPGGYLVLYGPFRIGGRHTAPSNEAFDRGLRARNPRWGVRDLEEVASEAETRGLNLLETVAMPANNQTLIFVRTAMS